MRKIYSLFLLMLLPLLTVAQDNMAISSTAVSSYYSSRTEKRLVLPHAAVGVQQEAMTSDDAGINISVGMWLKTTSAMSANPGAAILFRMGTGNHANNNGALQLMQSSTGALTFTSGGDNIGNTGVSASMGTATLNEWHHILLTLDSENNLAAVYVDGEQTGTSEAFGKFGYKWGDGIFQFVCLGWSGSFDELQLFNTALSADEAKAAYANARSVSSLASLYTFDEVKSGSTGLFESVAGSISGSDATWQSVTYGGYWESGLVTASATSETAPTLVEGREIPATEATVIIMDGEGGTLTATDGETVYTANDEGYTIMTGTALTLTATPEDGYNLIGIYATDASMENLKEIENGGTYTVVGDIILTARYTADAYTLTINNDLNIPYTLTYNGQEVEDLTSIMGGGAEYKLTLSVPENAILESVQLGEETLTAVNGVYTLILDADATLAINARLKAEYTVTINQPAEGGTVSVAKGTTAIASGDKVYEGDVLTLSNTNESGYMFSNYIINGNNTTENTYTVTGDVTISVAFEEGIDYCLPVSQRSGNPTTTSASDRGLTGLTVTDGTNSIQLTGNGTSGARPIYYDQTSSILQSEQGKSLSFTATGSGVWMNTFIYIDWNRDGFDINDRVFTNFATAGASQGYAQTRISGGTVPADAAGGLYRARYIIDWENDDPCKLDVGQTNDNGCVVIDFYISVPKQILDNPRTITVVSANEVLGSVSIEGFTETSVSTDDRNVVVKAIAESDYSFLNWTNEENEVVSADATYTYSGETDITLTANFGGKVTYTSGEYGTSEVTVAGEKLESETVVALGTEVTVTVAPADGKECLLTINGTPVDVEDNTYTFTVEANADINISFVDKTYRLSLAVSGKGSVEVWTSFNEDTLDPEGTQIPDGGVIPSASAVENLVIYFIPEEGETVQNVAYTIGDITTPIATDELFDCAYKSDDSKVCTIGAADITDNLVITVRFSDQTQGIEEIGIDPADGPVEYFNLQGVRVAAENLVPGFYIARQGEKTVKVLIRK